MPWRSTASSAGSDSGMPRPSALRPYLVAWIAVRDERAIVDAASLHAAALAYLNRWCGGEGECHV